MTVQPGTFMRTCASSLHPYNCITICQERAAFTRRESLVKMAAQFEYDESGGTSLYFLVSFYALILFPVTYYVWPSKQKKGKEVNNYFGNFTVTEAKFGENHA